MSDSSWWWLVLVPATFPMAYYGGYLASIRNKAEAWKTRTGEALGLLTIVCLVLVWIFTPNIPNDFGFAAFVIWVIVMLGLSITAQQGYENRREKSEVQVKYL